MGQFGRIFVIIFVSVAVTSCSFFSKKKSEEVVERVITPVVVAEASVETMSLTGAREVSPVALGGRLVDSGTESVTSLLDIRIIYFAYDSSEIVGKYADAIQAHADYLMNNSEVKLVLQGHTDERGSREYNLALGERRAQSVQRRLSLLGAPERQVSVVTYGEERPVERMHNEAAYEFNRRVELVYR